MPFTLSHPAVLAALWPVARPTRLPFAALAIGSMSPDFEFFLHLRPIALWSHTFAGLFGFCIPAGLSVFAVWEFVVRGPVRDLLGFAPEPQRTREPLMWWARVAFGVLIGATTHLLWDGVTHGDYWGARVWPGLRTTALTWGTLSVPWFNLLQHLSTVLGGLVVLGWCIWAVRAKGDARAILRSAWRRRAVSAIVIAAVLAGLLNSARGPLGADLWTLQRFLGRMAVGAMLGGAVGVLGVALQRRWMPTSETASASRESVR